MSSPTAIPPPSLHARSIRSLGVICTPSIRRSIPSRRARSIVAVIPGSTASHVRCQSRTGSPFSPREKEERCNAGFSSTSMHVRIISRIASVERIRVYPFAAAIWPAAVDLPTPVAPAIISRRGARLLITFADSVARPTRSTMRLLRTCTS